MLSTSCLCFSKFSMLMPLHSIFSPYCLLSASLRPFLPPSILSFYSLIFFLGMYYFWFHSSLLYLLLYCWFCWVSWIRAGSWAIVTLPEMDFKLFRAGISISLPGKYWSSSSNYISMYQIHFHDNIKSCWLIWMICVCFNGST